MKGLVIGQRATVKRRFSQDDLAAFIKLSRQPEGLGEWPAIPRQTLSHVPGPLIGALFSYLLGTQLPGHGTNYLKQRLHYRSPARVGEELTATVEIIRLRPEKELVNLRTTCTNASHEVVCDGEALVLVRDAPHGQMKSQGRRR